MQHVPESRDQDVTGRIDWLGALLGTIALGGLTCDLIESSRLTLFASPVVIAIVPGVVSLIALVFVEARAHAPMLPLELFRSRNVTGPRSWRSPV